MSFGINPTSFTITRNGRALFAYSGAITGGAGDVTLIDIANTGLDDLLCKMYMAVDWPQVTASLGYSAAIDGVSIFNNVANVAATGGVGQAAVMGFAPFEFIIPEQSAFTVTSSHDGASGGAARSAYLVAYPLSVRGG